MKDIKEEEVQLLLRKGVTREELQECVADIRKYTTRRINLPRSLKGGRRRTYRKKNSRATRRRRV